MEDIDECISLCLPNITSEQQKIVCKKLTEIGIDSKVDLKYVKENDLQSVLKPVQIRKLLEAWKAVGTSTDTGYSKETTARPVLSEVNLQALENSNVTQDSNNNSAFVSYKVPWDSMSEPLIDALKSKSRPPPKFRRHMIRVIADDIRKTLKKPLRRHLRIVAQSIVTDYPSSFLDKLGEDVVGSGYDSLVAQLEARIDNLNRCPFNETCLSREVASESGQKKSVRPSKKRSGEDYGCQTWSPDLPYGEKLDALHTLQSDLKILYLNEWNQDDVRQKMDELYPCIRDDINKGKSTLELKEQWPFMFEPFIVRSHMNTLVGFDPETRLRCSITEKGKRILQFFKSSSKPVMQTMIQGMENAVQSSGNRQSETIAIVMGVLHYFEERVGHLMIEVDDADGDTDFVLQLPPNPCIICHGIPIMSASCFSVSVDGHIVLRNLKTIQEALTVTFSYYFILNIHYSKETPSTMEFIQRCLFGLNPEKGTKQQMKKKSNISSKVLSLCNKLTQFDWNLS